MTSMTIGPVAPAGLIAAVALCIASPPTSAQEQSPEAGRKNEPIASAAEEALAELRKLYAAAVDRELGSLDPSARKCAEATFSVRSEDPRKLEMRFTAAGTPRRISGAGLRTRGEDLDLPVSASSREIADEFLRRFAVVWSVSQETFESSDIRVRKHECQTDRVTS